VAECEVVVFLVSEQFSSEQQCVVAEPVSKMICPNHGQVEKYVRRCFVAFDHNNKDQQSYNVVFCCEDFKKKTQCVHVDDLMDVIASELYKEQIPLHNKKKCVVQ
jgi:hypothetical protein